MEFKSMLVKELLANDKAKKVVEDLAPSLLKNPAVKLMGRKSCGEIFDLVVSKNIVPKEIAEKIETAVNAVLKD